MSQHNDRVYLQHMLQHVKMALELATNRQRDDLESIPMFRFALLHLICITGEAANRLEHERRALYPTVPWRDIVGMRNALIHGYEVVDLDRLWKTVEEDLPSLRDVLVALLEPAEEI